MALDKSKLLSMFKKERIMIDWRNNGKKTSILGE